MGRNAMHGRRGMRHGWRLAMWGGATGLLLLPWVVMRFTSEVDWTASDFLVFGVMLAVACGACELAAWAIGRSSLRIVAWAAIALAFLLAWAELAVGLSGSFFATSFEPAAHRDSRPIHM